MWKFYGAIYNNGQNVMKEIKLPYNTLYKFDVSIVKNNAYSGSITGAHFYLYDLNTHTNLIEMILEGNQRYVIYSNILLNSCMAAIEVEESNSYFSCGVYYWVD
jgi:hypothetical protein